MPKLDLTITETSCRKCGGTVKLQRHHKSCQKMFVRHFHARERTGKYKEFRDRYYKFLREDIVTLCEDCHKQIHSRYMPIIGKSVRRIYVKYGAYKPMCRWTWLQAEILMKALEEECDRWLAK